MNNNDNSNSNSFCSYCCCTQNSFVNVFQFGFDRLWVSSGEFNHDIFQSKVFISVFDEMNAIESTGVAVLGLNSNCVELVLGSVGNQHVSEATVIRFRVPVRMNRKIQRVLLRNEMPPSVSLLDRKSPS